MKVNPIKRKTICDEIIEQIKQMIKNGELEPGQKLPSERDLANMFNVGMSSIREAIIALSSLKLVKKTSEGTFVNDKIEGNYLELTNDLLLNENDITDLYETRKLLETITAELAAANANDEDIKSLEEIMVELKETGLSNIEKFARLDADFHSNIALASKNTILYKIISNIIDLLKDQIAENTAKMSRREEMDILQSTLRDHNNILDAIKNKDALNAKNYIYKHLNDQIEARKKL